MCNQKRSRIGGTNFTHIGKLECNFNRYGIFSTNIIWESRIGHLIVWGDCIGSNTGKKVPIRSLFVTSALLMLETFVMS